MKIILDNPEVSVPIIAVLLERYRGDRDALSAILFRLMEMDSSALGRPPTTPTRSPWKGSSTSADQFGPRVTTASGDLGVSANQAGSGRPRRPEAARRSDTGLRGGPRTGQDDPVIVP